MSFIQQAERLCLLRKRFQNSNQHTGLQSVYKAVILTTLLYGCETWVAYRRHVKVLEQFQQRILRSILGIHWQDRIINASILEQADTTSIEAHIVKSQLSWAGHVRRMPDTRVPKQLLYAELSSGKRKTGGQWKRYKDQLKANLKKCEMELQWENRQQITELAGDVHRVWELQTWSRDESPWRHRRESGERTETMTTTLQTVHHV